MSEQDKHPKRCHRIYLAGSWKNQQEIFLIRDILKTQGHEVDCFASEENGRISFNWSKLPDIQDKLPKMDAKDMLEVPRVQEAFREDKKWIDWCDLCLLTLPSGKSSHLEAGYAKGQGKTVVIFGDLKKGDFDVMYGFADAIFRCDELDQMVDFVNSCIRTILTTEKDDVHWITGQELREIYADDLSLDKYDEIRKRSVPAYEAMLAESLTEDQARTLLMWLVRNKKEMFSQIVCPNWTKEQIEAAEKRGYERALDDLGVLHGEDARKFNEELKNPSPLTPEAAEVMRKARELARK